MQQVINVSMEEAKEILTTSRKVILSIESEGVTSDHYKLMDSDSWTRNGIQSFGVKDDGTWSTETFAQFISELSCDCVAYTITVE